MEFVIVSDPRVVEIVAQARQAGLVWKQIPDLVASQGFMNTNQNPFQVPDLRRVFMERYEPVKVKVKQPRNKYAGVLSEELILRAIKYREEGTKWSSITATFNREGHRDKYGKILLPQVVGSAVLADPRGAHLRIREPRIKFKKKIVMRKREEVQVVSPDVFQRFGVKRTPDIKLPPQPTFEVAKDLVSEEEVNLQDRIHCLENMGFSPAQILAVLKVK